MAFSILSQLSCFLVSSLILFANVVAYLFSLISPIPPLPLQPSELLIVITGCDSGFGELLSKRFSQKGFRVISGCLTLDGIKNLESVVTKAVLCDVTNEVDLQKLAQEVEDISKETNSKLWAVINNAGIADGGALDWTEVKIWKKVMEVNFFAIVGMIRTMLPFLKRTPGSRYVSSFYLLPAGPL
jgi:NADP-dependent 3-hydroxy acid dehydrogenase YdfG